MAILCLLGVVASFAGLSVLFSQLRSKRWTIVKGIIADSVIGKSRIKEYESGEKSKEFPIEVSFTYEFAGQVYSSKSFEQVSVLIEKDEAEKERLRHYSKGGQIEIRCNPKKPGDYKLWPRDYEFTSSTSDTITYFFMVLGVLGAMIFGLVLCIQHIIE
jgi:hypothetical protein